MKTVGSFFCGIGGLCYGFEANGFATVWANDFDAHVEKTYRHNFPHVAFFSGDISKINPKELSPVDIVHGGFPCQSFSNAGSRQGFNDPKGVGKLFDTMMNKIEQLGDRPKILVFENVPNLLIGASGTWFEHLKNRIKQAGYWFSKENALQLDVRLHGGLPQRRERLFMIAVRKDMLDFNPFNSMSVAKNSISLAEILSSYEDEDPNLYLDKDSKYHDEMWAGALASNLLDEDYQLVQYRKTRPRIIEKGVCPTLTQNMGAGGHNVPFYFNKSRNQFRKLSVRQCLALQGFPDSFEFPEDVSNGARYRMIGNSVSPVISGLVANSIRNVTNESRDELELAV